MSSPNAYDLLAETLSLPLSTPRVTSLVHLRWPNWLGLCLDVYDEHDHRLGLLYGPICGRISEIRHRMYVHEIQERVFVSKNYEPAPPRPHIHFSRRAKFSVTVRAGRDLLHRIPEFIEVERLPEPWFVVTAFRAFHHQSTRYMLQRLEIESGWVQERELRRKLERLEEDRG